MAKETGANFTKMLEKDFSNPATKRNFNCYFRIPPIFFPQPHSTQCCPTRGGYYKSNHEQQPPRPGAVTLGRNHPPPRQYNYKHLSRRYFNSWKILSCGWIDSDDAALFVDSFAVESKFSTLSDSPLIPGAQRRHFFVLF